VTQVARCSEEVASLAPSTGRALLRRSVALAHIPATGVPVGVAPPFTTTNGLFCGVTIGLASLHGALLTFDIRARTGGLMLGEDDRHVRACQPIERYAVTPCPWERPCCIGSVAGHRHDQEWPKPEHDHGHARSASHHVLPPCPCGCTDPVSQGDGLAPGIQLRHHKGRRPHFLDARAE
jgi:hypothetical protein